MARIAFEDLSYIQADTIEIGKNFRIGKNVHINVRGAFKVGDNGRFGDDVKIDAQEVVIGKHFFHYTAGLVIGGGGSQYPEAVLKIGDRCVLHNNYLNVCREITIGNDVGISPDVDMITHGFWNSALEGYPTKYQGIVIGNGVIIGQRSFILMGVTIADNAIIGANSTVSKSLLQPKAVYAGNPARFIRAIKTPLLETRVKIADEILERYQRLKKDRLSKYTYEYPFVCINDAEINLELAELRGIEDVATDNFRDHLRRYGIKIYTERPFGTL